MDRAVTAFVRVTMLLLLAQGGPAAAQVLSDPTQPPAAWMAAPVAGADAAVATGGPFLQSVLISRAPGGRRVAVIDGQTVHVGGKVAGAVVLTISETEVVLRRGKALETLKLFPSDQQKIASTEKK